MIRPNVRNIGQDNYIHVNKFSHLSVRHIRAYIYQFTIIAPAGTAAEWLKPWVYDVSMS